MPFRAFRRGPLARGGVACAHAAESRRNPFARPEGPARPTGRAGPYFTDHVRLFRLAGSVRGSSGPRLLQLEDCRTLEVSDYTEEEVTVLGLEPVTPAAQAAEGSAAARDREDRGGTRAHQP